MLCWTAGDATKDGAICHTGPVYLAQRERRSLYKSKGDPERSPLNLA